MLRFTAAMLLAFSCTAPAVAAAGDTQTHIAPESKVYIEPMNGFEDDLSAAIMKKHVPVVLVDSPKGADYLITGSNQFQPAGWAKTMFVSPLAADHASIAVKDPTTGHIVYAYAWDKYAARKGAQSAAEGIAKHLKQFIEKR